MSMRPIPESAVAPHPRPPLLARAELAEAEIQQSACIAVRVAAPQDDGDQLQAAALRGGDEAVARLGRVAGLDAVRPAVAAQEQVLVHVLLREGGGAPAHALEARPHDAAEPRVAHGVARERGEVPRAREVPLVERAAWRVEVRVVQAEPLSLRVHEPEEAAAA